MKTRINGIDVEFRDSGAVQATEAPPLVFLHAFPLNQTMWDEQVAALALRCRTITLDLRGFGKSDAPKGPYSLDQMAMDVRALMSKLDIERAAFVGLSMGGYVALAFYRNYPGAISGLALADTRASADGHEARERRMKSAQRALSDGVRAIAEDMVPLAFAEGTIERRPPVVERMLAMAEGNSAHGIAAAQHAMAARPDSTYLLPTIDFPTLIIVGAEDKLTPVSEAEGLRDGIRGSKLQVISQAGHFSNMEQPEIFNSALMKFVEEVGARSLKAPATE